MRTWLAAVLVPVLCAPALAQGYEVVEGDQPPLARPATAVRVDVDVADAEQAFAPLTLPFRFR